MTQPNLFDNQPDEETKARILKVISTVNLKIYDRDIKGIWDRYTDQKNLDALMSELDEFFVDNDLYHEIEEEKEESPLKVIKQEDIQLVCYQWFKPD